MQTLTLRNVNFSIFSYETVVYAELSKNKEGFERLREAFRVS